MPSFAVNTRIDAPREMVWAVLADLGGIYKWNPGVAFSKSTSDSKSGDGATRRCDLKNDGGYLDERAFDWREGEGFKIEVVDTSLPLKKNIVTFTLRADGDASVVTVSPDYELKYGPIGALLDLVWAGRQVRQGMEELLAGLKYHVETGREVADEVPER